MTVGILLHDMHIDKATSMAVTVPAYTTAVASSEKVIMTEKVIVPTYHTHVERVSLPRLTTQAFRSTLPSIQQPREDDRRYVQNRKLLLSGGGDAMSLWPSV